MGLFSGILGTLGNFIMPGIGTAIGGIAGGLIDSNQASQGVRDQNQANAQQAANTNEFNAEQAALNRNFQSAETDKSRQWLEGMSGTSYQRSMADMAAAGLNPMLAASQGGASTPGSGAPSGSSASGVQARMENAKAAQQEMAIVNQRLSNETNVADATATKARADAAKAAAETANVPHSGANIQAQTMEIKERVREIDARIQNIIQDTSVKVDEGNLKRLQGEVARIEKWLKTGQLSEVEARTKLTDVETYLAAMKKPGAENQRDFDNSYAGKLKPYTDAAGKVFRDVKPFGLK